MKCELCDNVASVFYTQLVDGQMKKMHLCESCAEAQGVTDVSKYSLVDALEKKAVIPSVKGEAMGEVDATGDECPACGFGIDDFKKIGRMGCPQCYVVFGGELEGMLEKMHRGVTHCGSCARGSEMLAHEAKEQGARAG